MDMKSPFDIVEHALGIWKNYKISAEAAGKLLALWLITRVIFAF